MKIPGIEVSDQHISEAQALYALLLKANIGTICTITIAGRTTTKKLRKFCKWGHKRLFQNEHT
jgi:hypothetical protein